MKDLPVSSIEDVERALQQHRYVADRSLATTIFLALTLDKPLLLEGEAGVGKTEVGKVLAEILNARLANATGQTVERVAKDVDRDYIMEPDQAVNYGMIDRVIASRDLAPVAIKG